jgi:hypothetical protein
MENKQNIKDLIEKFYPYAKESLGFDHPVRVIMRQDAENAQQSLGKTAYYDPAEKLIVLYITDRHPKDVLRSFSHELVHHAQNCRGELDDLSTDDHYAKDGKGREIEKEAYLQGNFNVRDYEDNIKFKGVKEMKMTKSQLKGLIEQTIEKITEGGGKPDFLDLDKDGDKREPMKKAAKEKKAMDEDKERGMPQPTPTRPFQFHRGSPPFPSFAEWFKENRKKYATTSIARKMYSAEKIAHEKGAHNKDDKKMDEQEIDEQQMDMSAIKNVMAELRELSEMDSSSSRNLQRMGQEQYFRVLADKLERAMEGQVASSPNPKSNMGPGELEEQEMQPTIKGKEIKIEKEPKFVKKEKPKKDKQTAKPSAPKLEENNDIWYNSSLYESLMSKWAKKGDK